MMRSTLRPALAGLAAAAVLMTAACSADEESTAAETAAETSPEETAAPSAPAEEEGPVDVPNVVGLILETGQSNLMLAGLEAELVDATGAPVEVEDAMTFLIAAQDPADGQLDQGEAVVLTVEPRG